MSTKRAVLAVTLMALTGACAPTMSQVPVRGEPDDKAKLVGEWTGSFEGMQTKLHGDIAFNLFLGRHSGEGQWTMKPSGWETTARTLRIRYVEIDNGMIRGEIEQYIDPKCECTVTTKFEGTVRGNTMSGTFEASLNGVDEPQTGWWSAVRKHQ